MAQSEVIPLPRSWHGHIKSAFIHAIALTAAAFNAALGRTATQGSKLARIQARLDRANHEIALLKEEMRLKDARFRRVNPHRRPHYRPIERMQILQLRAARGWSMSQVADAFLLSELTIFTWQQRIDEEGDGALLQMSDPVSKFPDFVRAIVQQMKAFFPKMGKDKIAQILARAGLHIGATTVHRMIKEKPKETIAEEATEESDEAAPPRVVTAKRPDHVWHVDLSVVPTSAGFWVPWFPFTRLQRWPFCWWIAVVVDHFSRSVVGFAVYKKKPTSVEVRTFLGTAISKARKAPRHLIVDRDSIFDCPGFISWCKRKTKNPPRFGAVGKHGSIAVVERFIRTMKTECTRQILVPFRAKRMRRELGHYATWYNEHRPHTYLEGRTPREVYDGLSPANSKPRYEPRPNWPRGSPCSSPQTRIRGKPGARLVLRISFYEGRRNLPVIELKRVA